MLHINSIPKKFPNQNTGGALSNSKLSKFLREPPNWAFNLSRFILPSRNLRKLLLDPIRRTGWKHVKAEKNPISPEVERYIKQQLSDELKKLSEFELSNSSSGEVTILLSPAVSWQSVDKRWKSGLPTAKRGRF